MTVSRWLRLALRLSRNLGLRTLAFALLALLVAAAAPLLDPVIPDGWKTRFGQEAVLPVLNILASTMLAVTTFSLGVMVQAFRAAATLATPRAYRVVMQDTTTHTVLATFTGAFLFALTAIVMFRSGYYGAPASVIVFGLTLLTIAAIIVAILRWIEHLTHLGSLDHTLHLLEQAARAPLRDMAQMPCLGAIPEIKEGPPPGSRSLRATRGGYVTFVDMPALQRCLTAQDGHLHLCARPGAHVVQGQVLAHLRGGEGAESTLLEAITLGPERDMLQDPRFGLMVLNEVGMRALSPGVNDPGTAIDVIHRLTGLLAEVGAPTPRAPRFDRVTCPRLPAADLIEDGFHTLIRDGAARPEVAGCLLRAFAVLDRDDWPELAQAARDAAGYTVETARDVGMDARSLARLEQKA